MPSMAAVCPVSKLPLTLNVRPILTGEYEEEYED